jgi:hypothetical protein
VRQWQDLSTLAAKQSPQGRALTEKCIGFVLNTVPTAKMSQGQGSVDFQARRQFCYVVPEPEGCRLGFTEGKRLYDPRNRMHTTETEGSFVRVRALEDLSPYTGNLLLQAYGSRR